LAGYCGVCGNWPDRLYPGHSVSVNRILQTLPESAPDEIQLPDRVVRSERQKLIAEASAD